jgi:hypothetical protein
MGRVYQCFAKKGVNFQAKKWVGNISVLAKQGYMLCPKNSGKGVHFTRGNYGGPSIGLLSATTGITPYYIYLACLPATVPHVFSLAVYICSLIRL